VKTINSILTLQELIDTEFSLASPLIKGLLDPSETALFIARQKEGKSTLALQLAIDVACGDRFLDHYDVAPARVFYLDYENRFYRLKARGIDLANGRKVENLHIKAFEQISQRDVGLFGKEFVELQSLIQQLQPGLTIIDPLRYALSNANGTSGQDIALRAIDAISRLHEDSEMGVILVHHLKKQQETLSIRLKTDPRAWIERVYGSQALIAHVDTIWGIEAEGDGYTFATVPRSHQPLILPLEKHPESERFLLGTNDGTTFRTPAQKKAWDSLPAQFSWRDAERLNISNNLMNSVIRQARSAGLLMQDPATKQYHKTAQVLQSLGA
jgi:AAA domain